MRKGKRYPSEWRVPNIARRDKTAFLSDRCKEIEENNRMGKARDLFMEKAMATHSSTLAWKISWTEEPGRLQPMGSLGSDTTEWLHFHFSLSCIGEGNGNPLQCSCLENPRDGRAWWAAVYGVTQSWTRLKRLRAAAADLPSGFSKCPLCEQANQNLQEWGARICMFLVISCTSSCIRVCWEEFRDY